MIHTLSTGWTEERMLGLRHMLSPRDAARINKSSGSPEPEYREVWRTLTPGERTYLLVFRSAMKLRFRDKLIVLCQGDRAKADEIRTKIAKDQEGSRADIVALNPKQVKLDERKRDAKRKKYGLSDDEPLRQPRMNRNDVAAEALNRDLEPLLGPPRYDPIRLPERDPTPSPVRRVSIEEYEATKQRIKPGTQYMSFLPKLLTGTTKQSPDCAFDEVLADNDVVRSADGYDDPRREDEPHNPRYSLD